MQRDKKGRFIKKALEGSVLTIGNKKYKIKDNAKEYFMSQNLPGTFEDWVKTDGQYFLDPIPDEPTPNNPAPVTYTKTIGNNPYAFKEIKIPSLADNLGDPLGIDSQKKALEASKFFGVQSEWFTPEKIKYTVNSDGKYID
jgi:hypothetical protein